MPASSVPDLYNFEQYYEGAAANYFANVNANWFILTPQTYSNASANTDYQRTPRITIEFSLMSSGDQREFQHGNGSEYYAERTGQFTIQAVSRRNDTSQNHGLLRGAVRQAMLESSAIFNANTIPWYQTIDVWSGASSQSVDAVNDEILTQMLFPVRFAILPASFP